MALIQCPECGGNVSDKSEVCIHCGFPIQKSIEANTLYDVIFQCIGWGSQAERSTRIFLEYACGESAHDIHCALNTCGSILLHGIKHENIDYVRARLAAARCTVEFVESGNDYVNPCNDKLRELAEKDSTPVMCPICHSTQVITGQRGFSLVTGFIGSSSTMNRCAKCGHSWKP
jgi:hypothetical protein